MSYGALFGALVEASHCATGLTDNTLSDAQREAVYAPLTASKVVIAGPGAGKTRTLVARVEHLLSLGVKPEALMVCTFTRQGAEEFNARLATKNLAAKWAGTIHSLSLRLLKGKANLPPEGFCEQVMEELPEHLVPKNWENLNGAERLMQLDRCREEDALSALPCGGEIFDYYWTRLTDERYIDFLSLIERACKREFKQFKYLLIDESQDLTKLQVNWLRSVAKDDATFFLVGDDDQAIYAFRGSSSLAEWTFPQIQMLENHRSTPEIVNAANRLISKNHGRIAKKLKATAAPSGIHPTGVSCLDDEEEIERIKVWLTEGSGTYAVLCRTRWLAERYLAKLPPETAVFTVHESKGKEWDHVWLGGAEETLIPHGLSLAEGQVEDERRLMYVAITRARKTFNASYCSMRETPSGEKTLAPSRFLFELKGFAV